MCSTMNVHLGETFDKFVAELIASGLYKSQSEVIRDGLRLLKECEDLRKLKLEELRCEIHKGTDQLEQGQFTTYASSQELAEEIKAKGRQKLASSKQNSQNGETNHIDASAATLRVLRRSTRRVGHKVKRVSESSRVSTITIWNH